MQKIISIPVLLLGIFLGGCASMTKEPEPLPMEQRQMLWESNRQKLQELASWKMEGRLGVRFPGQSGTMSVDWREASGEYLIYLDGPLGQSVAKIEGRASGVILEASGERYAGRTPEQLLFQVTGWDLPVSHLRYWVLGLPSPESAFDLTLDGKGNPAVITQQGWVVEYQQFRQQGYVRMPSRLKVSQGDIQMTLAARSWSLK